MPIKDSQLIFICVISILGWGKLLGPNLDLLCVRQPVSAPFVKIIESFILMQNT